MTLTVGSLFSGVGGFDLGFTEAGFATAWLCEIDPKCRSVLARHWPEATLYEDVTTLDPAALARPDVVVGGFPCQDVSVAGRREGLDGTRSGLWFEFHRILAGLRPEWVVIENVPGLLSSNGGWDFAAILSGLVGVGYGVCWRILDAQYFGVAQRRRRVFIVGHLGDGRAAEVLFERASPPRHPPARKGAGQDAAERSGRGVDVRHSVITEDVAQTIQAKKMGGHSLNYMPTAMVPRSYATDAFAGYREGVGTLRANGGDAGQGSETLVVTATPIGNPTSKMGTNTAAGHSVGDEGDPMYALEASHAHGVAYSVTGTAEPCYGEEFAHPITNRAGDPGIVAFGISNDPTPKFAADVMPPLQSKAGTDGHGGGRMEAIACHRNASCAVTAQDDVTAALRAEGEHSYQFIKQKMAVRRLTPKEDERLMGWPDDHTRWGTDGAEMSDSTRYKMCGNGVVAPVAAWIARRIAAASR